MKTNTSNALFIGGIAAGIAMASVLAAPAHAQVSSAQVSSAQTATLDAPAPQVCDTDSQCYDFPDSAPAGLPAVDLGTNTVSAVPRASDDLSDPKFPDLGPDFSDPALITEEGSYQSSVSGVATDEVAGFSTIVGSVDRTAPDTVADDLILDDTLLPDNSELLPVESVTGVGVATTF